MVQIQVIVQHQHPVKVILVVVREVVHITVLLHQLLVAQGVLEAEVKAKVVLAQL